MMYRLGPGPTPASDEHGDHVCIGNGVNRRWWWSSRSMDPGGRLPTLGKSRPSSTGTSIRKSAAHQPALDTLVESWADAAVGVLMIVCSVRGVGPTANCYDRVFVVVWIVCSYAEPGVWPRIEQTLSSRWIEPEVPEESSAFPRAESLFKRCTRRELGFAAIKLSEIQGAEIERACAAACDIRPLSCVLRPWKRWKRCVCRTLKARSRGS